MNNFNVNDIISHYTTIETAVEHILFKWNFKVSKLLNSKDPFEYNLKTTGYGGFRSDDEQREKEIDDSARTILDKLNSKLNSTRFTCFCQNSCEIFTDNPCDDYGYARPRMWAEYCNHHTGCCLLLSKSKLKEYLEDNYKDKYLLRNIEYCDSNTLNMNFPHVSTELIRELGERNALLKESDKFDNSIFQKHKDFEQEKELRLVIFCEGENDIFIPIKDIIRGIVVSEQISAFHNEYLMKFTSDNDLKLFTIDWGYGSINIYNIHELNKRMAESIEKSIFTDY
jgi:Protein of unknown function (DUF2971)